MMGTFDTFMLNHRFLFVMFLIADLVAILQATSPSTQPTTSTIAPNNDPIVELTILPNAAEGMPLRIGLSLSTTPLRDGYIQEQVERNIDGRKFAGCRYWRKEVNDPQGRLFLFEWISRDGGASPGQISVESIFDIGTPLTLQHDDDFEVLGKIEGEPKREFPLQLEK